MSINTKWYVMKVTANHEKSVKELVEKALYARYLDKYAPTLLVPTEKVSVVVRNKPVLRERIIMPGYIFIEADLSHGELIPVLENVSGVYGFISMTDGKVTTKPIALRDREINRFLNREQAEKDEVMELTSMFSISEKIQITDGGFNGFQAVIEKVNKEKGTVNVVVTIFGRETPMELNVTQITKYTEEKKEA
jgi:transcription termination/antitermination protein NusG